MKFNFGKIKEVRESQFGKHSQKSVADHLNMSQSNYSRYESGDYEPTIATLESLANYYSIDLSEFFEFSGEEKIMEEIKKLKEYIKYLEGQIKAYEKILGAHEGKIEERPFENGLGQKGE